MATIGVPFLALVCWDFFATAYSPHNIARGCVSELESTVESNQSGGHRGSSDWGDVDACVAKVAALRTRDGLCARVYAVSRFEEGRAVHSSDIQVLAKSKSRSERAIAAIYAHAKLTPAGARQLVAELRDDTFINRLAKVHALEKAGIPGARKSILGTATRDQVSKFAIVATGCAILLGLGLWAMYFSQRAFGFLRPLGHPLGGMALPDADRCAVRAAQYMVLYLGISFGTSLLGPFARAVGLRAPTEAALIVLHSVLLAGGFILLTFLPLDGKRLLLSDIGITKNRLWKHAAWGLAGEIANTPILIGLGILCTWVFHGVPPVENPVITGARTASDPISVLLLGLGACVFAPLIEETWFRGTLLPALSTVTRSPVWGILITSLIFASLHPTGVPSWLPLASIGAMGAMLTYQTKSLVPAMVMHGVHNAVTLALTLCLS